MRVYYDDGAGALVVDFGGERTIVSSLHGIRRSRFAAVRYVGEGFTCSDMAGCSRAAARQLGLPEDTPVFFTAVERGFRVEAYGPSVSVVATVGLKHRTCISRTGEVYPAPRVSTVIVLASVEAPLRLEGLLDLYRTVSEAKAATLSLLLSGPDCISPGTVSDAVAVAAPVSGEGASWAGPATLLGWRAALLTALAVAYGDRRGPLEKLADRLGLTVGEVLGDIEKLYSAAPVPGVEAGRVREAAGRVLERLASDPNIAALVAAAGLLDALGSVGGVTGLSVEDYEADSRRVVADELLAVALADYVNGFRGVLAAYWADRVKGRVSLAASRLPMFSDDAAVSLAASILSKIYDALLGTDPLQGEKEGLGG